jgi:SAM-dependent methyltransferase
MRSSVLLLIRRSKTILDEIRKNGFKEAMRYACHRIAEHYGDWRLGIQTGRFVTKQELGYADTGSNVEYAASSYHALGNCFDRVPIRPGQSVCVDYGCGMGRVVIVAALRGFRKVIGVEYSAELADVARQNVRRAAKKLRCPVEIINADAQSYPVPDDTDVIFMANPFRGSVLANVIKNIHDSIRAHPRKVWIIFVTPDDFEKHIQGKNWIEKTYQHFFFRRVRYVIYCCHESRSERGPQES